MNADDGDVVIPGDVVQLPSKAGGRLVLGPGLSRVREEVHVTKCGVLRKGGNNIFYVDSRQKKYVPAKGECVLGVVTNARGEMFRVYAIFKSFLQRQSNKSPYERIVSKKYLYLVIIFCLENSTNPYN
jgi:exosome complex RNA-binding protein Rrp4